MNRRRLLQLAAGASVLPAVARAQTYPSRPITMIVPAAAGGPMDTLGRIIAERMRVSLGQSIVFENTGIAAGSVGVGRAARAAPDGYTLSIGHWTTHVVNGAVYPLQYDLRSDFQPISLLASPPLVIVSTKAVPARDLKGLIDWLKANPDKATQGTGGAGAPSHVSGLQFQAVTGTRFRFVPYRGAAPAMQDLLAGQIDLMFDQIPNALPHVNSGRIRAYAVTAKSRLAIAPDIPTVDEAGLPGFYFSNWHGLWVPKGTPANVVGKLNAAVVESLADQMVRSRLAELGFEIFPREQQTPEALAAHHKAEIEKWWPIIRAAGIAPE